LKVVGGGVNALKVEVNTVKTLKLEKGAWECLTLPPSSYGGAMHLCTPGSRTGQLRILNRDNLENFEV